MIILGKLELLRVQFPELTAGAFSLALEQVHPKFQRPLPPFLPLPGGVQIMHDVFDERMSLAPFWADIHWIVGGIRRILLDMRDGNIE